MILLAIGLFVGGFIGVLAICIVVSGSRAERRALGGEYDREEHS